MCVGGGSKGRGRGVLSGGLGVTRMLGVHSATCTMAVPVLLGALVCSMLICKEAVVPVIPSSGWQGERGHQLVVQPFLKCQPVVLI